MDIVRRAVGPLRILLVLTFAALVLFQTMSFPGMFVHFLYFGFTWDDPGVPLLLMLMLLGGGALGLLMLVMRALLRQATTLRTDMEAVI
jgi:Protein of unknown function (DUF2975)